MLPVGSRPATSWVHCTTSCNTQSSAPDDGQNNCPKHVEMTGIINKPLLLHLVSCLYYLYQWWTVKQISDNEIYLIKCIKSVLWKVAKRLSYTEDARRLKVKSPFLFPGTLKFKHSVVKSMKPSQLRWTQSVNKVNAKDRAKPSFPDHSRIAVNEVTTVLSQLILWRA